MQVSSATASSGSASSNTNLVEQIKRQAALLADDSRASNDQKIDAYLTISKAIAQSASTGSGWFQQSAQDDRDAVNAIMDNSSMAKQVRQAADDFNARGMRTSRTSNVMANQLDYLNGLSDTQQKMIFAGTASLDQTSSFDSWKDFLQQNADSREHQMAVESANHPAVKVTLSEKAKAALKLPQGMETDAEGAHAEAAAVAFLKTEQGDGVAGAALKMLQKAAEERAEAKENAKRNASDTARVYEAGDKVDTSI